MKYHSLGPSAELFYFQHFLPRFLRKPNKWACTMLSSNGFCLAKTLLNDFWLVSNLKHRAEGVSSICQAFSTGGKNSPQYLLIVQVSESCFESFGNSWTLPVLTPLCHLKAYTSILSPIGQDPFTLYSF